MREYKGYKIVHEDKHVKVIAPDGTSWTEDTVTEAHREIDREIQEEEEK